MLTHAQATQVKLAFVEHGNPAKIARDLGVPLHEVEAVLIRWRPRGASISMRYESERAKFRRLTGAKVRLAQQAITGKIA